MFLPNKEISYTTYVSCHLSNFSFAYTIEKDYKQHGNHRRKEVMNDKFSDKVKFRPFPIFGQSTAYTKTTTT